MSLIIYAIVWRYDHIEKMTLIVLTDLGVLQTLLSHDFRCDVTMPAVVFNLGTPQIDVPTLQSLFARFEAIDDVFNSDFTYGSIMLAQVTNGSQAERPPVSDAVKEYLRAKSSELLFVDPSEAGTPLPEGPYFFKNKRLHQAWRLYEDNLCSLVTAVIPAEPDEKHEFVARIP